MFSLSGALRLEWCVRTHHSTDNAPLNEGAAEDAPLADPGAECVYPGCGACQLLIRCGSV